MALDDEATSTLNEIIGACRDAEHALGTAVEYMTAVDSINGEELGRAFSRYADEHRRVATALQTALLRRGEEAETAGTAADALYRGWVTVRSQLGGDADLLAECSRSEEWVCRSCETALKHELPAGVRSLLERQYAQAKEVRDRIDQATQDMKCAQP
jgi:uncharacterized protein (TIGR02284 family)